MNLKGWRKKLFGKNRNQGVLLNNCQQGGGYRPKRNADRVDRGEPPFPIPKHNTDDYNDDFPHLWRVVETKPMVTEATQKHLEFYHWLTEIEASSSNEIERELCKKIRKKFAAMFIKEGED